MKVTEQQMKDARIDPAWRDYCAHLLIPLNKCRHNTFYLPWKCGHERHEYERCQYGEYVERWLRQRAAWLLTKVCRMLCQAPPGRCCEEERRLLKLLSCVVGRSALRLNEHGVRIVAIWVHLCAYSSQQLHQRGKFLVVARLRGAWAQRLRDIRACTHTNRENAGDGDTYTAHNPPDFRAASTSTWDTRPAFTAGSATFAGSCNSKSPREAKYGAMWSVEPHTGALSRSTNTARMPS